MDVFLLSVLLLSIAAVLYPFLIYPVILRLLPVRPVDGASSGHSASLLFCAYNEAAVIPEKIANLEALKTLHPNLQILAFDDGSSDDTARQLAARPDLLTLVRGNRSGKAHGMKRLAALATGDILIFTDANVMLAPEAIANLSAYYGDAQVGGVLGSLHYLQEKNSATASVGQSYWKMEERLKDLESRSGNVMGADGSIFSIRRALYPDFPDTVLDDLTVSMSVVFAGRRLIKVRDVIAFERLVSARGDEYRRKVRIAARAWHTHSYLRPQLRRMSPIDRFKYASRKVVRWFGGVFLLSGTAAALALAWRIDVRLFLAALGIGILLLLLGLVSRRGPLAKIADIWIAYMATLQGVFRAMRGDTFAVWNPAKSR
ncbi:glycosyltransferase [Sphingobium phenoxybenzoativorans]|uniref:glycosyltransferase n=1 Tax=Sphingobium phenoxybenzoativorans TaxID=1592790 RepID=UPI000872631C|nr:glycosyltransferase [Sphingobium phenoxybenzoativorans]